MALAHWLRCVGRTSPSSSGCMHPSDLHLLNWTSESCRLPNGISKFLLPTSIAAKLQQLLLVLVVAVLPVSTLCYPYLRMSLTALFQISRIRFLPRFGEQRTRQGRPCPENLDQWDTHLDQLPDPSQTYAASQYISKVKLMESEQHLGVKFTLS